jgi:tetratricopeptide (TPR) repeat protein
MRASRIISFVLVLVASQVMAGETNSSSGYERGLSNMNSKEWKEAILNFTDAIRLNPKDALAYEARGGAHCAMGELDKAINDFTQAIQLAPANDRLFYNRSAAHRAKREFDKAISDLSDTLRLNPTCELAWKCRADSYSEKGEFDKAINDWNEGLRLNPNDAQALGTRGHAYFMTSQFNKAVQDYRDAIRLDPQNDKAYNNFGWLRATCPAAEMRNGREAVELATKACELTNWKKWDWIDTLAAAYAEAGDFRNAITYEKQAMDMSSVTERYRKEMQRCLLLYEQQKPNHEGQKQ